LYVIDHDPGIRQFELAEDWVQNADETWPVHVAAVFVDQPEEPGFELYRPSDLENDALSAYYLGVGRKGWDGHAGSLGHCRWSPATKRWEIIEACFKVVALGVVTEAAPGIGRGVRGEVELWWKDPVAPGGADPWTGAIASGAKVQALNWFYERCSPDTRVAVAFDRQENLWMILPCEWPVMVDGTDAGAAFAKEVGKLIFDDTVPAGGNCYFVLTNPNPGEVRVGVNPVGINQHFNAAGWAAVNTMTFVNGLATAWT